MAADISLNWLERDALSEAGNIGAGHAATALSDLLGTRIMNNVTTSRLCSLQEAPGALGEEDEVMCGVIMGLEQGLRGAIMMIFPEPDALAFYNLLTGQSSSTTEGSDFTDAMAEVGNICICGYLNALAEMFDLRVFPTPPGVAVDMVGSLLDGTIANFNPTGDEVLIIQTKFTEGDHSIRGFFILFPDADSLDLILRKLGVRG